MMNIERMVAQQPLQIRMMTYNIRHGVGMDNILSVERIARVISDAQADVVAVQEVDSATTRIGGRDLLGEIADSMGYVATFGPAIAFGGGKYGVGILSREHPLSISQVPLYDRSERRTILVAEFRDYVFACTHLPLNEEDRLQTVNRIDSTAASYSKPFFIAGDWNDSPNSATLQRIQRTFQLCSCLDATFPADAPTECIDYIAVYKHGCLSSNAASHSRQSDACCQCREGAFVTLSSQVIADSISSDHRPASFK